MSIPDPELTFTEAIETLAAIEVMQNLAEEWRNDTILTSAHDKIQAAAVAYQRANPGSAEKEQAAHDLLKTLRGGTSDGQPDQ